MIKHSDSLDSWIKNVANKTFDNPLEYPEFEFLIKEFDNVPAVLPRFLFHLSHQMKCICNYLKIRDQEERTESVRDYFQAKHDESNENFEYFKNTVIKNLQTLDEMNAKCIKDLNKQVQDLYEKQETIGALDLHKMLTVTSLGFEGRPSEIFANSPKSEKIKAYAKKAIENKLENFNDKEDNQEHEFKSQLNGKSESSVKVLNLEEVENSVSSNENIDHLANDQKASNNALEEDSEEELEEIKGYSDEITEDGNPEGNYPKIYNLNTLKRIIKMAINRHKIAKDVIISKENDNEFKLRMREIERSVKNLEKRHLDKFEAVLIKEKDIEREIYSTNNTLQDSVFDVKRLIQQNSDKIAQLKNHAASVDRFEDHVKKKLEEILVKIADHKQESIDRDEASERRMNSKFDRNKKQTEEKFDFIQKEIAKMKTYVIEMCEMIKVTTNEKVDSEVLRLTEVFTEIKDNLIEKTDSILKRNKKSIANIKNSCALFFDKYDKALQYMQKRFDNINSTFEDYENNFMAPTKMREGRMFAIETKLKEQEDSREIEFNYLKLMIKRILDAFEQSVFVNGVESNPITEKLFNTQNVTSNTVTETSECALKLTEQKQIEKEKSEEIPKESNRTIIETHPHKVFPSLKSRVRAANLSFNQNIDETDLNYNESISRKMKRLYSSHKKDFEDISSLIGNQGTNQLKFNGDKKLHKRILFIKETLNIDPHLDENKKILRQIISEPKMEMNAENKFSPRERSEHNKSVINQEINMTKKNFFLDSLNKTEERI